MDQPPPTVEYATVITKDFCNHNGMVWATKGIYRLCAVNALFIVLIICTSRCSTAASEIWTFLNLDCQVLCRVYRTISSVLPLQSHALSNTPSLLKKRWEAFLRQILQMDLPTVCMRLHSSDQRQKRPKGARSRSSGSDAKVLSRELRM